MYCTVLFFYNICFVEKGDRLLQDYCTMRTCFKSAALISLASALFLVKTARSADVLEAVAVLRAAGSSPQDGSVKGVVTFRQAITDDCLADVTVEAQVEGLSPGKHGFHVHEKGDIRDLKNMDTIGLHFSPPCLNSSDPVCIADATHGLPPAIIRHPGDMGNIEFNSQKIATYNAVLGQRKMSLCNNIKSIIGRAVLIHSEEDDGLPPYGHAGAPAAVGVIGIKNPGDEADVNKAITITASEPTLAVCTFLPSDQYAVEGIAVLEYSMYPKKQTRLWAKFTAGLTKGTKSFHFHEFGDESGDATTLGPIYGGTNSEGIDIDTLEVKGGLPTTFDATFPDTKGMSHHIGRSLTVHDGPTKAAPTVGVAVCGIANPSARDLIKDNNAMSTAPSMVLAVFVAAMALRNAF